jgi:putative AdoMet-dependent methyltransferase
MDVLAAEKVKHLPDRTFVASDVLEYVAAHTGFYDAISSTYTLHHLTEEEKMLFLEAAADRLSPGGRLAVGDLISEPAKGEAESIAYYRSIGDTETAEDMDEEFFWCVDTAVGKLSTLGLTVETARFSRLSWCIKATK